MGLERRICLVGSKEGEAQECLAQKVKNFGVYRVGWDGQHENLQASWAFKSREVTGLWVE